METPFRVYIYCTGSDDWYMKLPKSGMKKMSGKVIGEFTCDKIDKLVHVGTMMDINILTLDGWYKPADALLQAACLTEATAKKYLQGRNGYGWHITELKIYDVPRPIRDFMCPCAKRYADADGKWHCKNADKMKNKNGSFENDGCICTDLDRLSRPPQSWCYVEDDR